MESKKKQIQEIQSQLQNLIQDDRRLKGYLTIEDLIRYPGTQWWVEHYLKKNEEERQGLLKKLYWLKSPAKKGETDIPRAKAYPITDLLAFNRGRKAICPWHNDTTPSLTYYPKNNTVFCFVCQKSGDSIDLVQELFKLSFNDAVKKLTR